MDFEPFDDEYRFDPNIFITDFPDYLLDKIKRWMRITMSTSGVVAGGSVLPPVLENLELRLRVPLPSNVASLINFFTVDIKSTRNMLTMILQNYANASNAEDLKALLRAASSAYSVERLAGASDSDIGGFILVNRVPESERMQAQQALSANDILRDAYIDCYKVEPNYTDAVRKANDFIEGLLTRKFWTHRTATYSIHVAVQKFQADSTILRFKGDSFVDDKSKVIALLDGIARIRSEHTTGSGRAPTADEAEFVVQTAIYLHNLLEPIEPLDSR